MSISALASTQYSSQIDSAQHKKANSSAYSKSGGDRVSFSDEAMAFSASYEASRTTGKSKTQSPESDEKRVDNEKAQVHSGATSSAKVDDDSEERLLFFACLTGDLLPRSLGGPPEVVTIEELEAMTRGERSPRFSDGPIKYKGVMSEADANYMSLLYNTYDKMLSELDEQNGGKANLKDFTEEERLEFRKEFLQRVNSDGEITSLMDQVGVKRT